MKKVLLHICCGICAYAAIERLVAEGFCVEGYFYNPNIDSLEEYQKRSAVAAQVCELASCLLHESAYEPHGWNYISRAHSADREGGARCLLCYRLRLIQAYEMMKQCGCDFFTTTLTISPHKKSSTIIALGQEIAGAQFLPIDFKKQDGFKRSIDAAKKYNFYRQNYCGCVYSKRT